MTVVYVHPAGLDRGWWRRCDLAGPPAGVTVPRRVALRRLDRVRSLRPGRHFAWIGTAR